MENQVIRNRKYQSVYAEMSEVEYTALRRSAANMPLSKPAQFQFDSQGYFFTNAKGIKLFKWEVYAMGYTDFELILCGVTPFKAIKK